MSKAMQILNMITSMPRIFNREPFIFHVEGVELNKIQCTVSYKNQMHKGTIGYNQDEGVVWSFDPSFYPESADEDLWLDSIFELISEYGLSANV